MPTAKPVMEAAKVALMKVCGLTQDEFLNLITANNVKGIEKSFNNDTGKVVYTVYNTMEVVKLAYLYKRKKQAEPLLEKISEEDRRTWDDNDDIPF